MTHPTTPNALPPLLKMLQERQPGDIYSLAAKEHLITGTLDCTQRSITNAAWSNDKGTLTVYFGARVRTTLAVEGFRVVTACGCRQWQPGRQCPHVVVAWAVLKRLVSPGTLVHIRFNDQLLRDVAAMAGIAAAGNSAAGISPSAAANTPIDDLTLHLERARAARRKALEERNRKPEQLTTQKKPYRLVLENSLQRGFHGSIQRGSETVYGWSTRGLPADLARFLASSYHYDSTPRYFESFLKTTSGNYPIVFRDDSGLETPLAYRGDAPRRACVAFDIRDNEVLITRTLDEGAPIPPRAVAHGHLLFDPEAGTIHPVTNRGAWQTWHTIEDELNAVDECADYDDGGEYEDNWSDDDDDYGDRSDNIDVVGLRRLPHGIAVPIAHFNATAVRLAPDQDFAESFIFACHGALAEPSQQVKPSYLLDIPDGISGKTVSLTPLGIYDDIPFPFSGATFWYLDPARRSALSAPLRAKKRVRSLLETCFALLDAPSAPSRNAIIRAALATPDYAKRAVKREARQVLTSFVEQLFQQALLLRAAPDGWRFLADDRASQARLLRIVFELFGADAFSSSFMPGGGEVPGELLSAELPRLASRLREGGFSLRLKSAPLTAATWEFTLDATSSSLDWFELRPEIRCDGELLNDEELRALLEGNGVVDRDGRMLLLDEASAQVLAMLAGSIAAPKRKRGAKAEPLRVPRLQILDWLQLRSHGVTVRLAPEDAHVLESLLNFEAIPELPLPAGLNATLRHYQADAWRWLAFLYGHRFGACLADDMGLGKTLQGITLLAGIADGTITSFAPAGTPHLVVAPPSLLFNWEAEIARFFPAARTCLYTGQGRSTETFADHDIVITSYGIVQRDIEQLQGLRFNVIIFDETQVVKNLQAATSNAVRKLKGSFALALTGTPVENHLGEYYAIMDLCLPGLLGSREEFSRQAGQGGQAGIERLVRRTRPFVLRRSKQMIAAELPAKIETDIHLELSPKQKALYQRTVEEVRSQVRDAYAGHAPAQARIIALTAILRLRQICLAPALALSGASDASPKLDFLAEQLAELRDEGHSALVFSQFTSYLDIIERGLRHHGLPCLRLDGSTPVAHRKRLVNSFQNSKEPAVFLISLKAGGKGLNLTRATYVFHMDPWWNPAVENQASDRAHRIGQTGQVTITRLIMRHTIEEKMMALKEQKLRLYKAILEEGVGSGGAALSREDFEFLLG
ncbi:MAG: DEAD/DEAH box helicase [Deltaproteobacteria bacterium]|nr:DEAD/DEAH box helicase [Deltaproteobacteria bacterium]